MRALLLILACIGLACVGALAQASPALAHASLIRSTPADGAVVAQAPAALTLTFNEPVSPLVLRLIGPDGTARELSGTAAENDALSIALPALARGTHLVSWRVVSADGHPVGGALTFSIGAPSAVAPGWHDSANAPLQWAIWIVRWVLYIGLICGVGGTFYAAWIAAGPLSPRVQRFVATALAGGFAAAFISVGLQGADALDLPPSALRESRTWIAGLGTSYGLTIAIAAVALALGSIALRTPPGRLASALALLGVGAAMAASGHASAAEPQLVTRPAVFLHGIAVTFWIGALVPLASAVAMAERRAAELARFSRSAPAAVIALLVSGAALAFIQLQRLDALWTTDYGVVLFRKLALVTALLLLAAVNRYAFTSPALAGDGRAARRLARVVAAELVLGLAVLGLVASWRFTPPPRTLIAAAAAPIHAHLHGERAMAEIKIEAAADGSRRIELSLLDGAFGPLSALEVTLVLAKPEAGIEPLRLRATHAEGVAWRIDRINVPSVRGWSARVEILISDFDQIELEGPIELQR